MLNRRTWSSLLLRLMDVWVSERRSVLCGGIVWVRVNGLLPFSESSRVKFAKFSGVCEKLVISIHSFPLSVLLGFGRISVILSISVVFCVCIMRWGSKVFLKFF